MRRKPRDEVAWLPDFTQTKMASMPYIVKNPNESIVFEIKGGMCLNNSVAHTSSFSIRFPTIVRERCDKSVNDATKLAYFYNLHQNT